LELRNIVSVSALYGFVECIKAYIHLGLCSVLENADYFTNVFLLIPKGCYYEAGK